MPAEIRIKSDKAVQKVNIIGTSMWVYSAWQRDPSSLFESEYSTITHIDDTRYGKIGSDDRSRDMEAQELIQELFPESAAGKWDELMNEMVIYG